MGDMNIDVMKPSDPIIRSYTKIRDHSLFIPDLPGVGTEEIWVV
jgi:hypothetical protein